MNIKRLVTTACVVVSVATMFATDYYVTDFGAKPDGMTLNTRSIQKAIDFAATNGGGRVVLAPGDYVCGTIYIKSGVTLHLEEGATLLGSVNPWDYVKDKAVGWYSFVYAIRQHDVGITGKGTINGRGFRTANRMMDYIHRGLFKDPLKLDRPNETNRPENIYFRECNNVVIRDITLRDPASWNQTYDQCHNVLVEGIKVDSKSYWNNDGIDIVDCEDVIIRNCNIDAADDVFCFKSHSSAHQCKNILLENCVGRSSANGIKFGTVSRGGFKNFKIRNITIFDTFRSAITFASVDGAEIENIEVDSLRSINTGNVIFLRLGARSKVTVPDLGLSKADQAASEASKYRVPYLRNIIIKNVYAEVPAGKPDLGYNYEGPVEDNPRNISPSSIVGLPDWKIENVTLENIEIVYPGAGNPHLAYRGTKPAELDSIPEMEAKYPEFSQWKELPAWGFYIRHANGVNFKNVIFRAKEKDYRPCIVADDVNGLNLKNVQYVEPGIKLKRQLVTYKSRKVSVKK